MTLLQELFLLLLFFACLYPLWRLYENQVAAETLIDTAKKFEEHFPGKCGICAFDRYGRQHGYLDDIQCTAHFCKERGRWV